MLSQVTCRGECRGIGCVLGIVFGLKQVPQLNYADEQDGQHGQAQSPKNEYDTVVAAAFATTLGLEGAEKVRELNHRGSCWPW